MSGEKAGKPNFVPPELDKNERRKVIREAEESNEKDTEFLGFKNDPGFGEIVWDDQEDDEKDDEEDWGKDIRDFGKKIGTA